MTTTTSAPSTMPLLLPNEIKDMIRSVLAVKGFDAFHSDDDIRFELLQAVDVHPNGTPVTEDDVTCNDIQMVRDYLNRARVTVTFRRGR